MSTHTRHPSEATLVPSSDRAATVAREELTAAGFEIVETDAPHRTRSTWVVPAIADGEAWRVHIDPHSGATRLVRTDR